MVTFPMAAVSRFIACALIMSTDANLLTEHHNHNVYFCCQHRCQPPAKSASQLVTCCHGRL